MRCVGVCIGVVHRIPPEREPVLPLADPVAPTLRTARNADLGSARRGAGERPVDLGLSSRNPRRPGRGARTHVLVSDTVPRDSRLCPGSCAIVGVKPWLTCHGRPRPGVGHRHGSVTFVPQGASWTWPSRTTSGQVADRPRPRGRAPRSADAARSRRLSRRHVRPRLRSEQTRRPGRRFERGVHTSIELHARGR